MRGFPPAFSRLAQRLLKVRISVPGTHIKRDIWLEQFSQALNDLSAQCSDSEHEHFFGLGAILAILFRSRGAAPGGLVAQKLSEVS